MWIHVVYISSSQIISLFLLNSWTKCTNLLINFSSKVQSHCTLNIDCWHGDMHFAQPRWSFLHIFTVNKRTVERNSDLITYNSNVTLFFSPFPLPFLCFKTFQLFSKPWTSFQQRHPSFYSCRFPFLLSQCSGTKRIALVYIWSLTWGYIQPHSVTGNCQKTFCTAISFFSNSFSGFYGKRKILSILLRRLNLLKICTRIWNIIFWITVKIRLGWLVILIGQSPFSKFSIFGAHSEMSNHLI